jgi:hypothetical protein
MQDRKSILLDDAGENGSGVLGHDVNQETDSSVQHFFLLLMSSAARPPSRTHSNDLLMFSFNLTIPEQAGFDVTIMEPKSRVPQGETD